MTDRCPWPELLASDGLPALETSPGYLVRRAHQAHASLWQIYVRQNLTPIQFGVLLVIDQHQEIDQTAVTQLMSLDKNTLTDVLRRLRSRGLVFSRQDPVDGRRMLTRLSDAGRRALMAATPAVRAIQDRLLESLRVRERQTFLELLRKAAYLGRAQDRRGTRRVTPRHPVKPGANRDCYWIWRPVTSFGACNSCTQCIGSPKCHLS
ncbi:MarR family winged helix-turn-helix transcriptional regulator [Mycolicibacterium aichiense]|uniref:MarR family winged helix-turn-helix transcriptional regulator n=1 Tax=Mycolicibacterium aichiense TaxID=1799 RepID=UPI003D669CA1